MSSERIDPEQLAAFLDGTLPAAERARVLEALARDPEELSVFADAAHVLDAGGTAARSEAPLPFRRRNARWLVAVPVLAAAVALLVILPPERLPGGALLDLIDGARLVDTPADGSLAARLGPGWDAPGWSGSRGDAGTLSPAARAFRLGDRVAALAVARGAGDRGALRSLAAEVALALQADPAAGPVAALFRNLAASADLPTDDRLTRAAAQARALVAEPVWFDLGSWTEAARLAMRAPASGQLTDAALAPVGRKIAAALKPLGRAEATKAAAVLARAVSLLDGGLAESERGSFAQVITELITLGGQ